MRGGAPALHRDGNGGLKNTRQFLLGSVLHALAIASFLPIFFSRWLAMPSSANAGALALGSEIPPSLQFLFDNFPEKVVLVTKELCLADESLSAIPRVLRNFSLLQRLDISRNLFRALPVQIMDEYMPKLHALDVSHNRLEDMVRVQELSMLQGLRELNLLGNPLVVVNQRVQLIASLLFDRVRPSRERLEAILHLNSKGRSAKQENVTRGSATAKPKIIANESTSRMIVSGLEVGQVLPSQAVKVLTSAGVHGNYSAVIYADMTPAPVPRPVGSPFRNLSVLNLETVTKEDLDQAARVCTAPQDTQSTAHARKKKRKKLIGKAKQQQLESDLQQIELDRRQRIVDKALGKLMRTGQLDVFRPGLESDGWVSPRSNTSDESHTSTEGGSAEEVLGEDSEEDCGDETLDVVHDKCVNPVSLCKALKQHLGILATPTQPLGSTQGSGSGRESPTYNSSYATTG